MINFTNWHARAPAQVWPPTVVQAGRVLGRVVLDFESVAPA